MTGPRVEREAVRPLGQDPILIAMPEVLDGEHVRLRPYRDGDAPALWAAIEESRAHLAPWLPWVHGYMGPDEARAYVARAQARWLLRDELTFVVEGRDGRFLGACGLRPLDWGLRQFEIGYWLRASAQGRGSMTEAVRLASGLAFSVLAASRIQIRAATDNTRSRAVALRAGYRLEGTLRRGGPAVGGASGPADFQIFALLPEEYRAQPWAAAAELAVAAARDFRLRIRAAAVIRDAEGRVLLVRQFPGGDFWLPPGGGVEPGELCREAAAREVREETGLEVSCGRLLWMRDTVLRPGPATARQHLELCFEARVAGRAEVPGDHEWGYFSPAAPPSANLGLPPGFWAAAERDFRDYDPDA